MATALVDIGTGSSIAFNRQTATGAGSGEDFNHATTGAKLLSLAFTGASRPAVKTTHMLSAKAIATSTTYGGDTFLMGDFADPGQLDCEFQFSPDNWSKDPLLAFDYNADVMDILITITDLTATNAIWKITNAACMSHEFTIPIEDVMTCSASFKISGLVIMVAGAGA